ncbi:MAG: hypothetical protein ACI8XI_001269, partial [Woeseiaceae bacterium]
TKIYYLLTRTYHQLQKGKILKSNNKFNARV